MSKKGKTGQKYQLTVFEIHAPHEVLAPLRVTLGGMGCALQNVQAIFVRGYASVLRWFYSHGSA